MRAGTAELPLKGIKVLDLSRVLAGPSKSSKWNAPMQVTTQGTGDRLLLQGRARIICA
jgi:hypothetical protein